MRNMSFFLTTPQMLARTKAVTRRIGWNFLKVGDVVMAVEKCQGLKKGEKIKRLYPIQILSVQSEPLRKLIDDPMYAYGELIAEGFYGMTPKEFVDFFCNTHKCSLDTIINRIEFKEMDK